jgi:hypothetical protein
MRILILLIFASLGISQNVIVEKGKTALSLGYQNSQVDKASINMGTAILTLNGTLDLKVAMTSIDVNIYGVSMEVEASDSRVITFDVSEYEGQSWGANSGFSTLVKLSYTGINQINEDVTSYVSMGALAALGSPKSSFGGILELAFSLQQEALKFIPFVGINFLSGSGSLGLGANIHYEF